MKTKIMILAFMISCNMAYSQSEYTASNGITYKIGDTIQLNRGSAPNGDFLYISAGGAGYVMMSGGEQSTVGRNFSGMGVNIKRIREVKQRGFKKIYFVVGAGHLTNYWLWIEDAIATCEIKDCVK